MSTEEDRCFLSFDIVVAPADFVVGPLADFDTAAGGGWISDDDDDDDDATTVDVVLDDTGFSSDITALSLSATSL